MSINDCAQAEEAGAAAGLAAASGPTANGGGSGGGRARQSSDGAGGAALPQRELTWALFENMWTHKYSRVSKTETDPKLIYQV